MNWLSCRVNEDRALTEFVLKRVDCREFRAQGMLDFHNNEIIRGFTLVLSQSLIQIIDTWIETIKRALLIKRTAPLNQQMLLSFVIKPVGNIIELIMDLNHVLLLVVDYHRSGVDPDWVLKQVICPTDQNVRALIVFVLECDGSLIIFWHEEDNLRPSLLDDLVLLEQSENYVESRRMFLCGYLNVHARKLETWWMLRRRKQLLYLLFR